MTTRIDKTVEVASVGSQKAGLPKAAAHNMDAQTLIMEKLIGRMVPDVLMAPASIDHNRITKCQIIKARPNMESNQRLRMDHSTRADFILRSWAWGWGCRASVECLATARRLAAGPACRLVSRLVMGQEVLF